MQRSLAALALAATLALVALGGVVHTTGSSLACPDWPLCGGEWMPEMVGGVRFEHSHRLLALLVVVLVGAVAWTCRGTEHARAGAAGVALVIVQALIGATTVLLRLPPAVSIAHLACATGLGAVLLGIAWPAEPTRAALSTRAAPSTRRALGLALATLLAQMVLGALVRHLHAGTACADDVVLCAGTATPASYQGWLQLAHRALGGVAFAFVLAAAWRASADRAAPPVVRRLTAAAVALAVLQVLLGLATVASWVALSMTTLHLVGAELLFLTLLAAYARVRPDAVRAPDPAQLAAPAPAAG